MVMIGISTVYRECLVSIDRLGKRVLWESIIRGKFHPAGCQGTFAPSSIPVSDFRAKGIDERLAEGSPIFRIGEQRRGPPQKAGPL